MRQSASDEGTERRSDRGGEAAHASGPFVAPSLRPSVAEALYVHVPFCAHKCHYCDFYSITRQSGERMERFVDLILAEAERWRKGSALPVGAPAALKPTTVFFGGGTPTLLPREQMARLIEGLRSRFDLAGVTEWTIEANPASVDADYCEMLRGLGVDRLSFGAQSFRPGDLALLEREHNPADVPASLAAARQAGFKRLNIDLIYGIPGQSLDDWRANLDQALALGTEHISCYALTYEPNTPLAVRKRLGQFVAVEESAELEMMAETRRVLGGAGFTPYEISNYARPGEECRHNLVYWKGGNYIGLGPSAASHLDGHRWKNRPHLGEWEAAVADGLGAATEVETLTQRQRAGELAWLMLRLAEGLIYNDFAARVGCDARMVFAEQIDRLAGLGLLVSGQHALRLSERGIAVADAIAAEFLGD